MAIILMVLLASLGTVRASLVLHLTFDDGGNLFADSSGFGNNGSVLSSDPSQSAFNIAGGGSLDLDGNDSVEINAVADDVPNANHTLSAWIRTTATNRPTFLSANTPTGGNSNMLFITSGGSSLATVFSQTTFVATAPVPVVNDGAWHHVVWARNGTSGFLYVDGTLRDTTNSVSYTRTATDLWSIGQEFDGLGTLSDFFNGQVDDVQIYDETLGAGQVSYMFSNPGTIAIPEPSHLGVLLGGALLAFIRGRRRRSLPAGA